MEEDAGGDSGAGERSQLGASATASAFLRERKTMRAYFFIKKRYCSIDLSPPKQSMRVSFSRRIGGKECIHI